MGNTVELSVIFLLSTFSIMATAAELPLKKGIPSVVDYFDKLHGDMTKLSWAHAVNNQSLLTKALSDNSIMMLEADVVLGKLNGSNSTVPIMAHPPLNTSDLSLQQFINAVIKVQQSAKKGIKLDFKSTEAFLKSLDIISAVREKFTFPVWLNADILVGPIDSKVKPVDADKFLQESVKKLPNATLSLGWTTLYGPNMTGSYTTKQLQDMEKAITRNKVNQPVTLAVRAGLAASSAAELTDLVNKIDTIQKSNKTSLTIWMSTDTDPVDIAELKNLILELGKSRIFLDVPEFIKNQLHLDCSSGKTPVSGALGAFVTVLTSVSALFTHAFKLFD